MKRRNLIIPSVLLAAAALLGVRTVTGAVPLGMTASGKQSVQASQSVSGDQIALQESSLAIAEARLASLRKTKMPALPPLPDRAAPIAASGSTTGGSRGGVVVVSASAPQIAASGSEGTQSSAAHDDDSDDEHEYEEEEHDDHGYSDDD